jgi:7,8-dihydropterin-6-yl-methyl-4-(beta-D-ribofuranosyl)aminobenzene 5'-phosphate synthase
MSTIELKAVDRVEVLTLQDNIIDLVQQDDNDVIQRARAVAGLEMKNSILAEHGFSALVTVTLKDVSRSILFDFGFSENGAASNADALGVDLSGVEAMALSHGHPDHVGGMQALIEKTGKKNVPLVLHPAAFRNPRFVKVSDQMKIKFPPFTRQKAEAAGAAVVDTESPYPLLDHAAAFLGRIPRITDYEKGAPNLCCEIDGKEQPDPFDDDSALVFNLKDKGLVVLSGCAHSGIVNTVSHARDVTGIEKVMAVMGGFHLSGTDVDAVIRPTIDALKALQPDYIVPTHCTGRLAVRMIEEEMPSSFILNMAGTRLTFSA